jgi:hypothetical protein
MDIQALIDRIDAQVDEFLFKMETLLADDVQASGLDPRAINRHETWFNEDCIVIRACNQRIFDYYGGMEYHDRALVRQLGSFVVYLRDDDKEQCRVSRIIDGINASRADEHDNEVKASYEGGVCPDCGHTIPDDVAEGQQCENCDHSFHQSEVDRGRAL